MAARIVDSLEGRFARWDSGKYQSIAERGYRSDGFERAFFPLYPLLVRQLSTLFGASILWSGFLISTGCFAAAGMFLYQWVLIDYERQYALWSVIWLYSFPVSFFFISFYAEALFLLTSIAAIYFARRGQFLTAGIAIAVAGATRPPAFLLAIPYVFEFLQQRNFQWRRSLRFTLGVLVAPLGTLAYFLFLSSQIRGSDLLTIYSEIRSTGGQRSFGWPWTTLHDGIDAAVFGIGINPDWFSRVEVWQDLIAAGLGLALAIWGLFHLRRSTALFTAVSMLFFLSDHGPSGYALWSIPRYVSSVFPIYLILALVTLNLPSQVRWATLIAALALLGLLSAWIASGRWVA